MIEASTDLICTKSTVPVQIINNTIGCHEESRSFCTIMKSRTFAPQPLHQQYTLLNTLALFHFWRMGFLVRYIIPATSRYDTYIVFEFHIVA